jgi:hypothetical protein
VATYPTVLAPLSPDSLISAREEFASANSRICSTLNEYGFTAGDLCSDGSAGVDPDAGYEALQQLVQMARDTIIRNSKFTGVTDPSVLGVTAIYGGSSNIRVQFSSQFYEGILVLSGSIRARVDSVGVIAISGNHYRDIYIPHPRLSAREAQQHTIGMQLRYWDEHGEQVHIVGHGDFDEQPSRVVLPTECERGMEFRVAWSIPVSYSRECWFVYIDSVSGDSLDVYGPYGGCHMTAN